MWFWWVVAEWLTSWLTSVCKFVVMPWHRAKCHVHVNWRSSYDWAQKQKKRNTRIVCSPSKSRKDSMKINWLEAILNFKNKRTNSHLLCIDLLCSSHITDLHWYNTIRLIYFVVVVFFSIEFIDITISSACWQWISNADWSMPIIRT